MTDLKITEAENNPILLAGEFTATKENSPDFLRLHLVKYRIPLLAIVLMDFISSSTHFLLTLLGGDFFMIQFHTQSSKGKLLQRAGIEIYDINYFFIAFFILLLAKSLSGYTAKFLSIQQGELFVKYIREHLFASQISQSGESFSRKPFGSYLLRYSNDMKAAQCLLTKGLLGLINEVLFLFLGLTLIALINPFLSAIVSLFISFILIAAVKMAKRQNKLVSASRDKRSNMLGFVAKSFSRFDKIKSTGSTEITKQRFITRSSDLFVANIQNGKPESILQAFAGFVPLFVIGIILLLISGNKIAVSAPDGLSIILILFLLQGTLRRLIKIPGYFNKGRISLDKINALL